MEPLRDNAALKSDTIVPENPVTDIILHVTHGAVFKRGIFIFEHGYTVHFVEVLNDE
jgi:hypothetical protein